MINNLFRNSSLILCIFGSVHLSFAMQTNDRLLKEAEALKASDDKQAIQTAMSECREIFATASDEDSKKAFLAYAALRKRLKQLNGIVDPIPQYEKF